MENPEQMDQTSPEPMQDSQYIHVSIEGDKIRCEVRGDHDKLASMIASVIVDKNAPLREIVDDAIRNVLAYELGKDNPEEILNAISESLPPKGAA
jgi:hypothetical protein